MSSYESSAKKRDNIQTRGVYQSSPLGTGLFVGLRAADPFLQYSILSHNLGATLIQRVGSSALPPGPPLVTGIPLLDRLSLSPYRLVLLAMSVGSAVKQNYWVLGISNEAVLTSAAVGVSAFNTIVNSLNSLFFITVATSASANGERFPQTPLLAGSVLYVVGILTETVSEIQRKRFKQRPENKGKVCDQGLWALARHINYGGYTLWRSGYAIAAGGWTWGAIVAGGFAYDFLVRGIPVLDEYCQERYAEQWTQFKQKVPYRFLPYIY
ncbi:MAG: hypothetical protein M1822_001958 [Bathelium mastoideum]|nr:MAG: hypothetical protein M1822_001958 [Bathelium mastoideum]